MVKRSGNKGFSLVELLTVIAIIAILAAVIFPVMNSVKDNARRHQCMTNLHGIAVGVQMFKVDNRRYPTVLGSEVYSAADNNGLRTLYTTDSSQTPDMFENVKDKYLFAEYVKTIQAFHCPSAQNPNSRDVVQYDRTTDDGSESATIAVYAYDSYDCAVSGPGHVDNRGFKVYRESGGNAERHYYIDWIPKNVTAAQADAWLRSSGLAAYPPGVTDDTATRMADYARQLRFRNPPDDTLVTWCSYHEGVDKSGKSLAVFLDGHADSFPAKEMIQCKWRIRPKKS